MKGVARRAWEQPVVLLTLAGLALYGVLRLSSALFYIRLGFEPEDVGLTYASTIGRALYGVVFLALIYAVLYFLVPVLSWLGSLFKRAWFRVTRRPELAEQQRAHVRRRFERAWSRLAGALLSGVVLVVVMVVSVGAALSRIEQVQSGVPQKPGVFTGYLWHAEAAKVYPDRSKVPLEVGQCVLYLGQAKGVWALYDPSTGRSWRVPLGSLTVETGGDLKSVEQVPEDC